MSYRILNSKTAKRHAPFREALRKWRPALGDFFRAESLPSTRHEKRHGAFGSGGRRIRRLAMEKRMGLLWMPR